MSSDKPQPPADPSLTSAVPTIVGASDPKSARHRPYRVVDIGKMFQARNKVVIGRASDCEVCLPHPNVSRRHAMLLRRPDGRVELRDLKSINGVYVGGHRLTDVHAVEERERLGIGPFLLTLDHDLLYVLDSSRSLRLEARHLSRVVPLPGGGTRTLLEHINLVVEPGEFVTLLGPSGSGKSTLMDALNGRRRATGGVVLANGEDFYRHFDSFRQSLGYVPQKDIVHTGLTVQQALRYTARLRLPADTGPGELEDRITEVLREMELIDHQKTTVGNLSGGEIKRVSLGAELIARPSLLYIDEATSGLDAGTDAKMMHLFRRLAGEGKSVVCITHNVENVESCHLILVLARGRVVYYGPPGDAPAYFDVRRVGDIYDRLAEREPDTWEKRFQDSELYHKYVAKRLEVELLADPNPSAVEQIAALGQELRDRVTHLAGEVLRLPTERGKERDGLNRTMAVPLSPPRSRPRPPRAPMWRQFLVLTERNLELLWRDRRTVWLLALQAPIVALFILVGFANKPYQEKMPITRHLTEEEVLILRLVNEVSESQTVDQVVQQVRALVGANPIKLKDGTLVEPEKIVELVLSYRDNKLAKRLLESPIPPIPVGEVVNPRYTYMLLFILSVTVIWFGCNNAAKEIVKEEAIYSRERAVNLGILPYLASKFVVLCLLTAFHTLLLMAVIYGGLELLHMVWPATQQIPDPGLRQEYVVQFGVLTLLGVTGVALGLFVSACVGSPDRASTLLPYVLIPQIILGGGIMAVSTEPLWTLSHVASPVYWAYRGIVKVPENLPEFFRIDATMKEGIGWPCVMLLVQTAALLLLTTWALKRKDVSS